MGKQTATAAVVVRVPFGQWFYLGLVVLLKKVPLASGRLGLLKRAVLPVA